MRRAAQLLSVFFSTLALAAPLSAKERLGVYQGWAAFRDPAAHRCYAIAAPEETLSKPIRPAFLSIGFWPSRGVTHQIYVRLSYNRSANSGVILSAGGRRFRLRAAGDGVWALDRRMDLAVVAAMRSATSLSIETIGSDGHRLLIPTVYAALQVRSTRLLWDVPV